MRRRQGFSLTELLLVVAIVCVLAAITFAVTGSAKRRSFGTVEASQLRQIYVATNLYESDHDQMSPDSLVNLVPGYAPAKILMNPHDVRLETARSDWPANPWIWIAQFGTPPMGDLPRDRLPRSKFINSYLYMKTYEGRFPTGRTYTDYRNNPAVGLIAGLGLMTCVTEEATGKSGCRYRHKDPVVDPGQPSTSLAGEYLTIRTDGSIVSRQRSEKCAGSDMPFSILFLFKEASCGGQNTAAPG